MRELLLLRHGKALRREDAEDRARPLADGGKRAVQRVGAWLARQALLPDHVVASDAERAMTSAAKCVKAMNGDASDIVCDKRIYAAGRAELLAVLSDQPVDARRVLLVGHNPGLKKLANFLLSAGERVSRLPKGSLLCLRVPDDWARLEGGQGHLVEQVDAAGLPEKFPFPAPDGDQRRDRPAYYYTQSSVVPYRIQDDRLEILIVRSSKNKHWVVPKGIAEPGHTLQSSAQKEAWEEAGVEGDVEEQAIGAYVYEKWGADCTVTVYPMRVTRIVDDAQWEERHRGRQWGSARVAAMLVHQPALSEIITAFDRQLNGDDG